MKFLTLLCAYNHLSPQAGKMRPRLGCLGGSTVSEMPRGQQLQQQKHERRWWVARGGGGKAKRNIRSFTPHHQRKKKKKKVSEKADNSIIGW